MGNKTTKQERNKELNRRNTKSNRKLCNDITWHHCQLFSFSDPKKVIGHRKREGENVWKKQQEAKSFTEPINYETERNG